MTQAAPVRWVPPAPRELPEWRAQLVDHTASEASDVTMREAIRGGRCNIVPSMRKPPIEADALAALILNQAERARLEQAELYFATADMTALALAAAATPPRERVSIERLPAESGFIVFAEPIGGYVEDVGLALAGTPAARPGVDAQVTTPIVAASWTAWTPEDVDVEGQPVTWGQLSRAGYQVVPPGTRGIWVTYYSPRGLLSGLPPETVLGTMRDGTVMTAGMIESQQHTVPGGPLTWDNEVLLFEGAPFEAARPDTTDVWSHTLYTAWQLMTSTSGTRWAEVEEIPRDRAGRKRDARQGISGVSDVRVVSVHTAQRPPREAAEADAAASTGRREPSWSCRWPVRPYRRSTCLNPGGHAAGDCQHEDRIVPGHIKGPAGAPLRTGATVHLWDRQPQAEA
ncbi:MULTISPECIES: hypothetical protein [unclassified Streptomyces]|uniref:hypothetical protein n=1 Tax=unclassified Streptomyces TaxID=2593676 RepID=UPI0006ADDAA8|nr:MULTISPECIES: hypothetical protein [unclassified Streptomyces]KOU78998.1 hypothetical protein ADK93_34970 [Streptomyces sp. XY58]KOV00654.1 hypothetical protein ADK89_33305 [Streptomyces sp. XY37]